MSASGRSAASTSGSASNAVSSADADVPAEFTAEGFPIAAPLQPEWWGSQVIALGTDGVLLGYRPGGNAASILDIGITDLDSLAIAP